MGVRWGYGVLRGVDRRRDAWCMVRFHRTLGGWWIGGLKTHPTLVGKVALSPERGWRSVGSAMRLMGTKTHCLPGLGAHGGKSPDRRTYGSPPAKRAGLSGIARQCPADRRLQAIAERPAMTRRPSALAPRFWGWTGTHECAPYATNLRSWPQRGLRQEQDKRESASSGDDHSTN